MSDKVSKAELYSDISKAICGEQGKLPPFNRKYYVEEISPGLRVYLRETKEENVVEYVHEHCLANDILNWLKTDISSFVEGYNLEFKHAVEAARMWRAHAKPVKNIKSVLWPYEEGLTYRRLPWPKGYNGTPTFNEMFARISNGRALKCFIGSLFVDSSDMQAYVWLHGQGFNGKGALSRFLHKVFGNAYSSQFPPVNGDRFWTSMIMGKRLVVFPDCNNQSFVASGLFKSLTGADPVRVEQKNQPAATAVMTAKYMFLSNERPALSSEKADMRRIIYCEMGEIRGPHDPHYEEKLWEEGGSFINECLKVYQNDCPEDGMIPVAKGEMLQNWISTVEEELEVAFENNFAIQKDAYILPRALQARLNKIWPRDRKRQAEFVKWLERNHGVRKTGIREGGQVFYGYKGILCCYAGGDVDTSESEQQALQTKCRWEVDTKKTASRQEKKFD